MIDELNIADIVIHGTILFGFMLIVSIGYMVFEKIISKYLRRNKNRSRL
tara:strand:- start:1208 stop:1354 length:147 start_codon:yes stop_codon:yes gene_type:complete